MSLKQISNIIDIPNEISQTWSKRYYELFIEKINWLLDKNNYNNSSKNCKSFVTENSGSTEKILKELYE